MPHQCWSVQVEQDFTRCSSCRANAVWHTDKTCLCPNSMASHTVRVFFHRARDWIKYRMYRCTIHIQINTECCHPARKVKLLHLVRGTHSWLEMLSTSGWCRLRVQSKPTWSLKALHLPQGFQRGGKGLNTTDDVNLHAFASAWLCAGDCAGLYQCSNTDREWSDVKKKRRKSGKVSSLRSLATVQNS